MIGVRFATLPTTLATLSDRIGCWDGEADVLREALAAASALNISGAAAIDPVEWMRQRLRWLHTGPPHTN
jgi:hypothetical protein